MVIVIVIVMVMVMVMVKVLVMVMVMVMVMVIYLGTVQLAVVHLKVYWHRVFVFLQRVLDHCARRVRAFLPPSHWGEIGADLIKVQNAYLSFTSPCVMVILVFG